MRRVFAILGLILICVPLAAQETGNLIINPRLKGGLGMMPDIPAGIVRIDTMPPGWKSKNSQTVNFRDIIPPNAGPTSLLITGMVPDASRRYVVAVTKDEEEFQRAYPEYKRLIAEKKYMEASQVLHIYTNIAVSTKVESFWGHQKTADLPDEVGSFFLDFLILALHNWGGCLTFLSYQPKPGDDVVDFGYGLSDTIHGVLIVEEHPGKDGGKPQYTMKVIKAKLTQ